MVKYEIRSEGGSIRASSTSVKADAERTAAALAVNHEGQRIMVFRNGRFVNSWMSGTRSEVQR